MEDEEGAEDSDAESNQDSTKFNSDWDALVDSELKLSLIHI